MSVACTRSSGPKVRGAVGFGHLGSPLGSGSRYRARPALQQNEIQRSVSERHLVAARVGGRPTGYVETGQQIRPPAEPVTSWKASRQDGANVSQGATAGRDRHYRHRALCCPRGREERHPVNRNLSGQHSAGRRPRSPRVSAPPGVNGSGGIYRGLNAHLAPPTRFYCPVWHGAAKGDDLLEANADRNRAGRQLNRHRLFAEERNMHSAAGISRSLTSQTHGLRLSTGPDCQSAMPYHVRGRSSANGLTKKAPQPVLETGHD